MAQYVTRKKKVIAIARYLFKYKGQYRIKPNLDKFTNDFPRDESGNIDQSYDDIYIKCANDAQIYHYGHSTLVAYIPSLGRGHNILISIAKQLNLIPQDSVSRDYGMLYQLLETNGTIFNIVENDSEIEFKFNAKNIDLIAKFLKPQTSGADISPFSTRNLPKSNYTIPNDDIECYKKIIDSIPKGNKLLISHLTSEFMSNYLAKDKLYKTAPLKSHMRKMMLKGKEYIHSVGYWDKYLKFLERKLNEEKR